MEVIRIPLADVRPNIEGRVINQKSVVTLAESMNRIGLLNPITVVPCVYTARGRADNPGWRVVAGGHRHEAAKMLGWEEIDAFVLEGCDDVKSQRMVEISENLFRSELSDVERGKLTKEWVELVEEDKPGQLDHVSGGRGKEGGISLAARVLPVPGQTEEARRSHIRRSMQIANMSPEAHDAARDLGLDSNQSALLKAAKQTTPEAQIESLRQHAERKMKFAPPPLDDFEAREAWVESGMKWWNRGGARQGVTDDNRDGFPLPALLRRKGSPPFLGGGAPKRGTAWRETLRLGEGKARKCDGSGRFALGTERQGESSSTC